MSSKPWKCREGYRCLFGDREGARRPSGGSLGGGTTREENPYYAYQQYQQHYQQQQQQANDDSIDVDLPTLRLPRLSPFSIRVLLLFLAIILKIGKLLFYESKNESSPPKTSHLTISKVNTKTIGMILLVTAHTASAVGSGDSSKVGSCLIAAGVVAALAGQMSYPPSKSSLRMCRGYHLKI